MGEGEGREGGGEGGREEGRKGGGRGGRGEGRKGGGEGRCTHTQNITLYITTYIHIYIHTYIHTLYTHTHPSRLTFSLFDIQYVTQHTHTQMSSSQDPRPGQLGQATSNSQ